jgi:hypothetical protein
MKDNSTTNKPTPDITRAGGPDDSRAVKSEDARAGGPDDSRVKKDSPQSEPRNGPSDSRSASNTA